MANKMSIYSKPFVLTVFIFLIGIMMGIWVDNARTSGIKNMMGESEILWEDTRLLNMYITSIGQEDCEAAFEENLAYNNRIYGYGKEIEAKMEASTFAPEIEQEWRKYILLQFQFWLNSIELKEKCNFDYSNVVYFFRRDGVSNGEEIDNRLQSTILLDLKEKCGRGMMLIPLTTDENLETIDLAVRNFNITKFPAVVIDEEHVFQGLASTEELEMYVECS